jgi:hypothetical protein
MFSSKTLYNRTGNNCLSILDHGFTKGLCGVYNGDVTDDFLPRAQLAPTTSEQTFAESWQYVLDNTILFI